MTVAAETLLIPPSLKEYRNGCIPPEHSLADAKESHNTGDARCGETKHRGQPCHGSATHGATTPSHEQILLVSVTNNVGPNFKEG